MNKSFQPLDSVVDELVGGKIVAHRPTFARCFGGATAGLLLSQFWYYSMLETSKEREGWFYAPMDEIEDDTGLTRTEQETARRKLREAGVLEEDRAGIPARLWFRINKERAMEQLRAFLKADAIEKSEREEKKKARAQERRDPADKDAGFPQTRVQQSRKQECRIPADKQAEKPRAITKKTLRNPKIYSETASSPGESLLLFGEKREPVSRSKNVLATADSEFGRAYRRKHGLPEPDAQKKPHPPG